jgi:hypothetical protein
VLASRLAAAPGREQPDSGALASLADGPISAASSGSNKDHHDPDDELSSCLITKSPAPMPVALETLLRVPGEWSWTLNGA